MWQTAMVEVITRLLAGVDPDVVLRHWSTTPGRPCAATARA
jgi:hypothetical protein